MDARYERSLSKDGLAIWKKNGKRIAKKRVPEEWIGRLDMTTHLEVKDTTFPIHASVVSPQIVDDPVEVPNNGTKLDLPFHECIFCGKEGKMSRYYDGNNVWLCADHYHEKSLGKIAMQLRERSLI